MNIKKKNNIEKKWYLINAKDQILGRISSKIINIITGKNKPTYTTNQDLGDNLIIINIKKIKFSGDKKKKIYYSHSGQIGKLKKQTFEEKFKKNPIKIILHSIKGMLPKNKLGKKIMKNIFMYNDENYKQIAQKPKEIKII